MYKTLCLMSYQKRNIFSLICKKYFLQIKSAKNLSLSSKQLSKNSNINENINENTIKIAIIGSGPAGFYTAQHLLKDPRVTVDIYEKFPVPFGLVRFGVAPDHQEVKNVINSFTTTALNNRTTFMGNVSIGSDITLPEIREEYNAVVLCYGAGQDRLLNIEGEDLANVISARRFVGWYNGVPHDKDLPISLDCETAVIIGHGNVAIDCARILLTAPQQILKNSDITDHSLRQLKQSKIKTVYIVGRRGPLQVSFTIKEFRELTKVQNFKTIISSKDCEEINEKIIESLARPRKRLTELIVKISKESSESDEFSKKCFVKFLRTPKAIKGDKIKGVTGIVLGVNKIENIWDENPKIIATNECEQISCGLVLRSIGFKSISIDPSLPFDQKKGTILNVNGRVVGCGDGLYCSGWAGTGPQGVILNSMSVSFEVAKNILQDIKTNKLKIVEKLGNKRILDKLKSKGVKVVHFSDWQRIDRMEQLLGSAKGKPREKIVDINKMIDIAKKD